MNNVHESANVNVTLNDKQAGAAIDNLENKVQSLKQELKELRKANDLVGYNRKKKELSQYEKELRNAKRQVQDVEHVLKNLNKTSLKDLQLAQRKLNAQLRDMSRSHPDYKKFTKQNALLSKAIQDTRMEQKGLNGIMSKAANVANKYFNILMVGIGILTGLIFSAKEWVSGLVGMDDQLANVMKTTGLSRTAVRELHTEFKLLNTRTPRKELLLLAEEAGRLGKKSKQDVMEFVRVGNMIQTALGDDLGDNAAESIKEVGKLVNIYKIGAKYGTSFGFSMEMVGSSINEVSANSQAQAPFLIDMLKRMGGIADQADIAADQVIGYGAALDNLGQQPETSATALNKVIVNMFKDTKTYAGIAKMGLADFSKLLQEDSNEAFLKFLEGLNGNNEGLSVMVSKLDELKLDGARSIQVLSSLASNTKLVREQQEIANTALLKATSLTDEYNIKNNNMAGNLSIIGQRLQALFVNSTLNKGLESVVGYFAKWAKYSLVDKLDAEMRSANRLVDELVDVNTEEKRRKEIFDELKAISPDIVKGMSDENIEADKLAKNMSAYNVQMVKRIFLQKKADEIAEIQIKAQDLGIEKLELEQELRDNITKMINATAKKSPETAESMQKIRTSGIDLLEVERQIGDQYFYNRKKIGDVGSALVKMRDVANEVKVARGKEGIAINIVNEALEKQKKLEEQLLGAKKTVVENPDPSGGKSKNEGSIIPKSSDEIEAEFNENLAILDEYHKGVLLSSMKMLTAQEISEDRYKENMLLSEIAYLDKKKELQEQAGLSIADTEIAIQNKILSLQALYEERKIEIKEQKDSDFDEFERLMGEEIQAEFDKEKEITKNQKTELEKRKALRQRYMQSAMTLTNAWSNFTQAKMNRELQAAGDNEAAKERIEEKYAEKQQKIALAQTRIQGALAIIKNTAQLGFIPALPVNIAQAILTAAEIALIKSEGFFYGGHTGPGANRDVKGVVHANEYVIPEFVMNTPGVTDIVGMLEAFRTGATSSTTSTTNNYYSTVSSGNATREDTRSSGGSDSRLYDEIKEMKELLREGLKFEYKKFRDFEDEVSEIENSVRMQ